jgi:ATP-dependent DNA ligase
VCKATLEMVLANVRTWHPIQRAEGHGETVFRHACNLGLEGIVSKRKDFRLPVWPDWLKIKNADTPAVKRERRKRTGAGDLLTANAS